MMNRSHILKTDNGELEVMHQMLPYPLDPEERTDTIFIGVRSECPTCSGHSFPLRTTIDQNRRAAAFVSTVGFSVAEQAVAFRYPAERAREMPKEMAQVNDLAFPLTGRRLRVVIGDMHADLLLAMWLLTLSDELFRHGRFPHPLPSGNRLEALKDRLNRSMYRVARRYRDPVIPSSRREESLQIRKAYTAAMPELFRLIGGSSVMS